MDASRYQTARDGRELVGAHHPVVGHLPGAASARVLTPHAPRRPAGSGGVTGSTGSWCCCRGRVDDGLLAVVAPAVGDQVLISLRPA
jgi:hypothetical protein